MNVREQVIGDTELIGSMLLEDLGWCVFHCPNGPDIIAYPPRGTWNAFQAHFIWCRPITPTVRRLLHSISNACDAFAIHASISEGQITFTALGDSIEQDEPYDPA